ncbi:hypothetical protein FRC03_009361 [Tulasnella sp. 419]|nr:hypothetical protein FRC03_009361 [Tulasnella sp. 419]
MVNTRKPSGLAPMPPNSRTNSTTNAPKAKSKRAGTSPSAGRSPTAVDHDAVDQPKSLSDVTAKVAGKEDPVGPEFDDPPRFVGGPKMASEKKDAPAKTSKGKSKPRKSQIKPPPPPSSIFTVIKNTIRAIILFSFLSYSVVVCPFDSKHESPVCLGLHDLHVGFTNYIRDPYLQPQINKLLAHPQVNPVVDPVVRISTPVIEKATPLVKYVGAQLNYQYVKHSAPLYVQIRSTTAPYVKQLDDHYQKHFAPHYNKYAAPVISQSLVYVRTFERYAEPYLYKLSVFVRQTAIEAKPYVALVWVEAQKVPGLLKDHVWDPLMELRRTFVDPHISKMMKAVEENGGTNGHAKPSSTRFEKTFMARAEQTVNSKKHAPAVEQEILGEEDPLDTTPDSTVGAELPSPTGSPSTVPDHHINSHVLSQMEEIDLTGMSDDELSAFLNDLADEDSKLGGDAPAPQPEQVPETEESIAERKRRKEAETAEKRRSIHERHSDWEKKVAALKQELLESFPAILEESRKNAVEEINKFPYGDKLQAESDKAQSAITAYVKKLMSENSTGGAEKVALLENLVNKIKSKFDDSLSVTSEKIIQWWDGVRKAEGDEIEKVVAKLKTLGTEAQADLGLDYAWLDDVTVQDWTRYHELLGAAESLKKELIELANGSSPKSPSNALNNALRQLQLDLQDVGLGFKYYIDKSYRRGLNTFAGRPADYGENGEDAEPKPEATAKDIPSETGEPEVSILPIPDGEKDRRPHEEVLENAQHVFMSKGKEQVEQAVKMAEEANRDRDEL